MKYTLDVTINLDNGKEIGKHYEDLDGQTVEETLWSVLDFPATTSAVFVVVKQS